MRIAVYIGHSICLDYDWLERETENEWTWLFACPVTPELQHLARKRNVLLLGVIPHHKIPTLLSIADYGVIPFLRNDLTKYVFPVKYVEYLAAGLTVVMTQFYEGKLPGPHEIEQYDWKRIAEEIEKRIAR